MSIFPYAPIIFTGACFSNLTIFLTLTSDLPVNFITIDLNNSSIIASLSQFNVTNINTTMSSKVSCSYQSSIIPGSNNFTYDVHFKCDSNDRFDEVNVEIIIVGSILVLVYVSLFAYLCAISFERLPSSQHESTSMPTNVSISRTDDISLEHSNTSTEESSNRQIYV
jgi:hypothetical protein